MHIYLIITLLCVFLGFEHGVKAQSRIDNQSPKSEHQIKQSDNCLNTTAEESQNPVEVAFPLDTIISTRCIFTPNPPFTYTWRKTKQSLWKLGINKSFHPF